MTEWPTICALPGAAVKWHVLAFLLTILTRCVSQTADKAPDGGLGKGCFYTLTFEFTDWRGFIAPVRVELWVNAHFVQEHYFQFKFNLR